MTRLRKELDKLKPLSNAERQKRYRERQKMLGVNWLPRLCELEGIEDLCWELPKQQPGEIVAGLVLMTLEEHLNKEEVLASKLSKLFGWELRENASAKARAKLTDLKAKQAELAKRRSRKSKPS